jgi:hypothetical protein
MTNLGDQDWYRVLQYHELNQNTIIMFVPEGGGCPFQKSVRRFDPPHASVLFPVHKKN